MAKFFYVYILESEDGQHHYTGVTEDLRKRFDDHNADLASHREAWTLAKKRL